MPGAILDSFASRLDTAAAEVEALLDRLLDAAPLPGEAIRPARLLEAMRYATLGGGKRLRPFLVVEAATLFDVPRTYALMAGAALECVHCYSLAHDDLPAMDDDALRRGRPTLHKAFDPATAILAGDSLLTFAFDLLARPETHPDAGVRAALIAELARASGLGGMAGGQMLDLIADGRFGGRGAALSEGDILLMQAMKTGALLTYACRAGAILGYAAPDTRAALDRFGKTLGQAYQISDDLLDVEGDAAMVGKATGKDAAAGKATLIAALGLSGAKARLEVLTREAEAALAPFGSQADTLRALVRFVASRQT
jgi:farnesyl diphosphate synthase